MYFRSGKTRERSHRKCEKKRQRGRENERGSEIAEAQIESGMANSNETEPSAATAIPVWIFPADSSEPRKIQYRSDTLDLSILNNRSKNTRRAKLPNIQFSNSLKYNASNYNFEESLWLFEKYPYSVTMVYCTEIYSWVDFRWPETYYFFYQSPSSIGRFQTIFFLSVLIFSFKSALRTRLSIMSLKGDRLDAKSLR